MGKGGKRLGGGCFNMGLGYNMGQMGNGLVYRGRASKCENNPNTLLLYFNVKATPKLILNTLI